MIVIVEVSVVIIEVVVIAAGVAVGAVVARTVEAEEAALEH